MINIKSLYPNNSKIDEKSYKNVFIYLIIIYYISYLLFTKQVFDINSYLWKQWHAEKSMENYVAKFKISNLIRSTFSSSDNYEEKYMNIKINLDDDLSLRETLKLQEVVMSLDLFSMLPTNTIHKLS